MAQPPLTPHQNLKVKFFEFACCNDIFMQESTTRNLEEKNDILKTAPIQHG